MDSGILANICASSSQDRAKVEVFLTALGRFWKQVAMMLFHCICIPEASLDTVLESWANTN